MLEFDDALIISDLHLTPANPKTAKRFIEFCENEARQVQSLFIIGDLFEFWVGDDVHLQEPFYQDIAASIRGIVQVGIPVFFIEGNRDFIIGKAFAHLAQWQVLEDPCLVQLGGQSWVLSHGDILCTADSAYQLMRSFTRIPFFQFLYRLSPTRLRAKFAERLRERARAKYAMRESFDPMTAGVKGNVTLEACHQTVKQFACPRLIHGHTHLPGINHETYKGDSWTRYVLSDWDLDHPEMPPRANAFRISSGDLEIVDLVKR